MSHLVKGILSFPNLFTPRVPKGGNVAKFSTSILIHKDDPQVQKIQGIIDTVKADKYPTGMPRSAKCCWSSYDDKYQGEPSYDPKFKDYYVLSCGAKEDDRPSVVDASKQEVIDPSKAFPGVVAYVSLGISGYDAGTGGIGGWLNGVMLTNEEPPLGRLDSKPSVDQMFASVPTASAASFM